MCATVRFIRRKHLPAPYFRKRKAFIALDAVPAEMLLPSSGAWKTWSSWMLSNCWHSAADWKSQTARKQTASRKYVFVRFPSTGKQRISITATSPVQTNEAYSTLPPVASLQQRLKNTDLAMRRMHGVSFPTIC